MDGKKKKKRHLGRTLKPYLMILPAMIGIAVFTIYPAIRMVIWSFYKVNQLNKAKTKFVGLQNFQKIFKQSAFQKALVNTGIYSFWTILFILGIALICAIWLNTRKNRLGTLTQTAMFVPHIISTISIGLIFAQMMNTNGLFNAVLTGLGFEPSKFTRGAETALMSVCIVAIWKAIGYYTTIIIGSLQSIPASIYEAAALDDAGTLVTMRKITIPMLSPQLFFSLIVLTIGSFKVFETVRVMTGGGPNNASNTLVYYIYEQVMRQNNVGYAAAAGTVLLGIVGVLTIIYFGMLSKKVHYQ